MRPLSPAGDCCFPLRRDLFVTLFDRSDLAGSALQKSVLCVVSTPSPSAQFAGSRVGRRASRVAIAERLGTSAPAISGALGRGVGLHVGGRNATLNPHRTKSGWLTLAVA